MTFVFRVLCVFSLCVSSFYTFAAERFPLAPPDTSSPQATYLSFTHLVEQANQTLLELPSLPATEKEAARQSVYALFNKAMQCFDLSEVPKSSQQRVALESVMLMKEILDRLPEFEAASIPDQSKLSYWRLPHTQLIIEKQADGKYLFSAQTVDKLYSSYQLVKHLPNRNGTVEDFYQYYSLSAGKLIPPAWFGYIEALPDVFMEEFSDQAIWQWLALAIVSVVLFAYGYAVYRYIGNTIMTPIFMALGIGGFLYLISHEINMTGKLMSTLNVSGELLIWLLVTQSAYLIGYKACTVLPNRGEHASNLRQSVTQIVGTLVGSALAVSIFGYGLSRIGVPVYGIVTGLSLGGMAIALAIRPTMENLIGGVILFMDKSLSVGDYCQIGQVSGVVERIGVRSTRIRAKDRTQITIANGDLVKMEIVNFTRRDRYPFSTQIGLRYETTMPQVEQIAYEIKTALLAHPDVLESPLRVHFSSFGEYSLNIDVLAHIDTKDRNEFLQLQQDLLMRIEQIVKANHAEFALPAQTTYLHMTSNTAEQRRAESETLT
ncbi:mechanosensitive ion channel family protein [Vibrio coralliilyticus]|uniref:mechanosensitive ion channel family protein n=1 Tax=Vibrio coralliilyticus TaxID=190893 RepID=UPI0002F43FED|nr:mechanosensitive ion channel family protein [Vibrio coralliilyticus]